MRIRKRQFLGSKPKIARGLSLFFLPLLLSGIGLFFVFEASSVRSFTQTGNSFHFFQLQLVWIVFGVIAMIFFSFFNSRNLYKLSFPLMMSTIILLVLVLIPGIGSDAGGARRWLNFGAANIQPTEIAKLAIIVYLASWFSNKERKRFGSFISLIGFLLLLIMLQPDMGTSIIVFLLSIIMYFLAGQQLGYLLLLLPFSAVAFWILTHVSSYRARRFMAYLDPTSDPLGIGYHINQIHISLANGGFFGKGFGVSQQKYLYLPEAHTDSIFAIIGEELGFIGSVLLVFCFFVFIYKLYQITYYSKDRYSRLLSGGIFAYFCLQIIINLGGIVSLIPLTGVPLPFISYGGSNLLVSFALVGVMLNISRSQKI